MTLHPLSRGVRSFAVVVLLLTSFGWTAQPRQSAYAQPYTTIPAASEAEPNDTITPTDQSNNIGPAAITPVLNWQQQITGAISTEGDIDWYAFEVAPASTVAISLTNLTADYDIVLSAPAPDVANTQDGLEDITDVGSSISAIGSSISAIGSSISAIGSSISAIGSSISAIGSSISAISVQPGTSDESIETLLWQPGTYYIAVAGNNGALSGDPYTLRVRVTAGGLATPPPAPDVQLNLAVNEQVETLYITSFDQMRQAYASDLDIDADISRIESELGNFAFESDNVGRVIDLGSFVPTGDSSETVAALYDRWLANQANPLEANRVTRFIDNVIKAATIGSPAGATPALAFGESSNTTLPPYPNVKNIVLVGGDNVLPFFRVPDLTTIANEAAYAAYMRTVDPSGVIDPNNPQGAALRYRTIQTDAIYGTDAPYRFRGYPLFVPNRAVGRLVERPSDISNYLEQQNTTPSISLEAEQRAFVTGYDFLTDQAEAVSQTLRTHSFNGTNDISGLISNNWTNTDFADRWFDGEIDTAFGPIYDGTRRSPFAVQSFNAHFDHWQILPAANPGATFLAQRVYTPTYSPATFANGPYFIDSLAYSVGCHSGFNVIDQGIAAGTANIDRYRADFPQAFLKQGGLWIGNTGYGYGSLDSVDYSERLSVLFSEELGRADQTVGNALTMAKQRYLRNATDLSEYDAKVLMVMNLYGLPFANVVPATPLPAAPEDQPDAPANQPIPAELTPENPLGTLERTITFTLELGSETNARTGSAFPTLGAEQIQVDDSFVQAGYTGDAEVRTFEANQIGAPVLPKFAYDITALSAVSPTEQLVVRDVTFVGGSYGANPGYNPLITQVVTETSDILSETDVEPSFAAGAGIWYPARFFGHSSTGQGAEQREQLVVTAAQFKAAADGTQGTLRPYTQMTFKVRYTDPGATNARQALTDTDPPVITSVNIANTPETPEGSSRVVVVVSDLNSANGDQASGVASVDAVFVDQDPENPGEELWKAISFTPLLGQAPAPGQPDDQIWVATVPQLPDDVRVIVSATDVVGNTAFYTAKGTFALTREGQASESNTLYLPLIQR